MDGIGDHYVKQNKPDSERQISYIFSYIQNLDLKQTKWQHEHKRWNI
jgi:hypothetical protein